MLQLGGQRPLQHAIYRKEVDMCNLLLGAGVSLDDVYKGHETMFHWPANYNAAYWAHSFIESGYQ